MEEWAGTSARRSRDPGGKAVYSVGSTSTVGTFTSSLVVSTSTLGSSTVSVVVPTSTSAVSTSKAGICPPSVFTSGRAVSLVWSISTSPNANTAMTTSTATTAMITPVRDPQSEEHTTELQQSMRISNAAFCLKKKTTTIPTLTNSPTT